MTTSEILFSGMTKVSKPSVFWEITKFRFQDLENLKTVNQRNDQTVFDHTMNVLDCLKVKNQITVFSALFHDIGKYQTKKITGDKISFIGHQLISAEIAEKRMLAWNTESKVIDSVTGIIKTHMLDIKSNISRGKIRKFIAEIGLGNVENWFTLRRADASSYHGSKDLPASEYQNSIIDPFEKRVLEELKNLDSGSGLQFDPSIIGDGMTIVGE
jgi:tRNA nucleotidyltransferase (CCA-adding enzyme)